MAKTDNLGDFLRDLADGIRTKKGTSEIINAQNFRSEIESIVSGGGPSTIELTQIEYNALEIKDEDTYYLIMVVI